MPDLYVWADDPVNCSLTLKGVRYSKASDIQFVFAEGSAGEVGRAKATRSGSTATARWDKAKGPQDDSLWRLLQYYVEVDGVRHTYFAQDIYVYAKKITIEAKGEDGKALVGAIAVITQEVPVKGPDGKLTGETRTVSNERKTDGTGKIEYSLTYPGDFDVRWKRPFVLVKWAKQEGTKWSATVKKLKFTARLEFPRPPGDDKSKPHKQYVNLTPGRTTPHYGSSVKVVVAGKGAEGQPGDEVFLKAEYDGNNSDRSPPDGGNAKGTVREHKLQIGSNMKASFELPLGHAGGDRVTIKVGTTPDCADDEVIVENWRRIHYELMSPQMLLTNGTLAEGTLADGTNGYDYNNVIKDWFKDRLDKGFVEYVCCESHVYPDSAIPAGQKVDGSTFAGGTPGREYFTFGKNRFTPLGFAFHRTSDPLTVAVWLCERAFSYAYGATHADFATGPQTDLKSATATLIAPGNLFPKRLDEGDDTVIEATWEAVVDAVATPDHPGVGQRGPIPASWLDFTKGPNRLGITLQGTAATLVGPAGAAKCPIRIKLKWFTYYEINGNAGQGEQTMVVDRPHPSTACTICHELGHSMGMAVLESNAKSRKAPPPAGLAYPKTVLEGGDVYDDTHGHKGAHCANGCPGRPVGAAKFSFSGKQGTCIMFGEGADEEVPKRQNFCAGCLTQIKGRRIESIKVVWSAVDPKSL